MSDKMPAVSARVLAVADRRYATSKETVDGLVAAARELGGDPVKVWMDLGYGPCVDALVRLADGGSAEAPALGLIGAAVLRLVDQQEQIAQVVAERDALKKELLGTYLGGLAVDRAMANARAAVEGGAGA